MRHLLRMLARLPFRIVFGNDSGWSGNIAGRRRLAECRRTVRLQPTPSRAAEQLAREGWVRLEPVDQELVDEVATGFERQFDAVERGVDPVERYLVDPHTLVPAIADLLTEEAIAAIEGYYGTHFRVRTIRAYRNFAIPVEPGDPYGNRWHEDGEIVCDLRYFVYLSPHVDRTSGALHTINRQASRRIMRFGFFDRKHWFGPARRAMSRGDGATVQEGPRGTSLLVDTQRCLHRASVCAAGSHRDIVQFWITPAKDPLPHDWVKSLGPDPSFAYGAPPGDG